MREFARASRRLTPPHRTETGAYILIIFEAEDEVEGVCVLQKMVKLAHKCPKLT